MEIYKLWLGIFVFGLTIWLGLYLLGREPKKSLSWFAGGALISICLTLFLTITEQYAPTIGIAQNSARWRQVFFVTSVLCWLLFLIKLVPGEKVFHYRMQQTQQALLIILSGTILFALSMVGVLFPLGVPVYWAMMMAGVLLFGVGSAAAAVIANEQTEAFWPDYWRSLDYAFFMAFIFGGQIALVMRWATGVNYIMLILLFGVVTTAVIVQAFSMRLAELLDQIAFFTFPTIRQERADLRASGDAAARLNDSVALNTLSGEEFAKLTRRAIGEMGNLPRLAANPLTQLPLISSRLQEDDRDVNTLAQANELKRLLKGAIVRLKPASSEAFGSTDEWRHFNALYFPYVVGLRPYRRYFNPAELSAVEKQALEWFRSEVPPRTLYNWQQAAARLIAQDLREQSRLLAREKST